MAWTTTLVTRLRYYIGDIASDDWTDAQLQTFIAIAAVAVVNEVDFSLAEASKVVWVIDTDTPSISPDPLSLENSGASNLFVLKAACIVARAELRKDISKYGIKIRDDVTQFDATGALTNREKALMAYCKNYEDALYEWELGNKAAGKAILGPYSSADNEIAGHHDEFFLWDKDFR